MIYQADKVFTLTQAENITEKDGIVQLVVVVVIVVVGGDSSWWELVVVVVRFGCGCGDSS